MSESNERWKLAQSYEKDWWANKATDIDLEFYKRFASDIEKTLFPFIDINSDTAILEIGSGAAGIITYLKSNKKFAIDPLEDFFSSVEKYSVIRDKKVIYKNAMAEELPFGNDFFDLIIIDNVLDHCENPRKVLSEMNRVLKSRGIIYFRQNTYHLWGKMMRKLIEMFKIDKGHPHTFSKSELRKMFYKNQMEILLFEESGYFKTWLKEFKSNRFYDKMKAMIFATRDKTTFVLRNMN